MRVFLAVVTDRGKHDILDADLVRKYRLRAGMQTPLSSHPIISVTKKVRVAVEPEVKKRPRRKFLLASSVAKKKSSASSKKKSAVSKKKKAVAKKKSAVKKRTVKKAAKKPVAKKKVKAKKKASRRK